MQRRIAILGGGLGALSTAFELSRRSGFRDRFEITVYQMGHRLGGKGASSVNADEHHRIEEHGLHIFWGFYENTFRMMREVYAELGRSPDQPLATFEQAFFSHDLIVVPERKPDGTVGLWPLRLPRNERQPGDGLDDVLAPWDYVPRVLAWLLQLLGARTDASPRREGQPLWERAVRKGGELFLSSVVHGGRALGRLRRIVRTVSAARALASAPAGAQERHASQVLFLVRQAQKSFARLVDSGETDERLTMQIDLALTLVRGLIADGLVLPPRDFHAFDDESLRDWLGRHGARLETLRSPLLEGLHAAIYSSGLEIAAGTAVHGLLRIAFTYKGSILWKMRAGMGETIFAPLYEVLRRRGVRFELFHRVDALRLSDDRRSVDRVELTVQARARDGGYRPLTDVGGLPVWPRHPDWSQLEGGDALRESGADFECWWRDAPGSQMRTLVRGTDFDEVVLGISIGALPDICGDITADNPRFASMLANVKTTLTQSAQLWFDPPLSAFGHDASDPPIVIPYTAPMDTWADMSHLLARETWPAGRRPATCAYLTARLEDVEPVPPRGENDYPDRIRERVRSNTARWLRESAGALWPGAGTTHDPRELNWHWLHDQEERDGEVRLEAQWIAPVPNPSDRYVLSLPGSTRHRLRSHESGYENLTLAGDWTRNAINGGCAESAVMSGLDAARCLDPGVRPGIGDWLASLEAKKDSRSKREVPAAERPLVVSTPSAMGSSVVRTRELPRYAVRDGELTAVPPIQLDVDVSAFVLRADREQLQRLLDGLLNLSPELAYYRALAPLAVLYCARVDNHALTDPLGFVPELDFGFWVPALGGRLERGRFTPDRLVTFSPYLWVSNDVAMTNGRSIFGFFKDIGTRMQMPAIEQVSEPLLLDAWVMPRFGDGRPIEEKRLIEVHRATDPTSASGLGGLGRVIGTVTQAITDAGRIDGRLSSLRAALTLARTAPRGQRMVLLKQTPDVLDARRACYQAIVETDITFASRPVVENLGGGDRVVIHEYDSHRVARSLGLVGVREERDRFTTRSVSSARARFQATLASSTLVWERGASSAREPS